MEFEFGATPYSVTVRRNPHRRARQTPSSNAPDPSAPSISSVVESIRPFPPLDSESDPPQRPPSLPKPSESPENLCVFLRIRPLDQTPRVKNNLSTRNVWPKSKVNNDKENKKKKAGKQTECLVVTSSQSVTLNAPPSMCESKRAKTEIYDGFAHVFSPDSLQSEVYDQVMAPLVSDFIGGKSRLLAAMGPTGSGKTHTIFGCPREPGLVPLALRQIFNLNSGMGTYNMQRSYYFSMFEICSDRKGERICDLCPDETNLDLRQSTIKGVKEAMVINVMEAERFIACGLLKRATAATNANNQSSRSQCIINICSAPVMSTDEVGFIHNDAVLTIADLAGAERERRTGNQGSRLLESTFINNTSMVFGLCLRSLLEHQKNPKRPLQKHFQNSLLTKYLREYLEGKKRMTLILTAKPGDDDYIDTSFLLRHASPYMNIKFTNTEEFSNMPDQKRHILPSFRTNQLKRRKCDRKDAIKGFSLTNGGKSAKSAHQILENEMITEQLKEIEPSEELLSSLLSVETELQTVKRNYRIVQDFSRALWNVLKEYKNKLQDSVNEVKRLKEFLRSEKAQFGDLQTPPSDLKLICSCHDIASTEAHLSAESIVSSTNSFCMDAHLPKKASEHINNEERCGSSLEENVHISWPVEALDAVVIDMSFSVADFKSESPKISVTHDSPTKEVDSDRSDAIDALKAEGTEMKHVSPLQSFNVERPRRKLLPASTILVKEVGAFDMKDDISKCGKRAEKKESLEERRTRGSHSLVQLLQSNLYL